MSLNILIADDAEDVAEVVAFGARMSWPDCKVSIAASGEEALHRFEEESFDLVILDILMPPPDGLEICRRIREMSRVPILMLSVRSQTLDKVRAFDLGADDYLTKPFDHLELLARLRALVRRGSLSIEPMTQGITVGDLFVDLDRHQVYVGGEVVDLTPTEYQLLHELVRNAGRALPHQFLLERVWGPEYIDDTHYLAVYVRRLRQKLGDDVDSPRYIETVWGIGYRFILPEETTASPGTPL